MTALMAWPRFDSPRVEPQGAKQMAAPAEPRTPNVYRAKRIAPRECGWKGGDSGDSAGEKPCPTKRQSNPLDTDRPSHGRRLHSLTLRRCPISPTSAHQWVPAAGRRWPSRIATSPGHLATLAAPHEEQPQRLETEPLPPPPRAVNRSLHCGQISRQLVFAIVVLLHAPVSQVVAIPASEHVQPRR